MSLLSETYDLNLPKNGNLYRVNIDFSSRYIDKKHISIGSIRLIDSEPVGEIIGSRIYEGPLEKLKKVIHAVLNAQIASSNEPNIDMNDDAIWDLHALMEEMFGLKLQFNYTETSIHVVTKIRRSALETAYPTLVMIYLSRMESEYCTYNIYPEAFDYDLKIVECLHNHVIKKHIL